VKMLGQDDFRPMEDITREEMDPRSYRFKSVGARLAVVSAGVVMNAILALVLFVTIAMVGKNFIAPVLGEVRRHYPAAEAQVTWHEGPARDANAATQPVVTQGLKVGDRVTRIEGDSVLLRILGNDVNRFDRLSLTSVMADEDEKYTVTVEREVDGNTWVGTAELGVRMGPSETGGERLIFGISPAADTLVRRAQKYTSTEAIDPYEEGDRVVAVAGRPVHHAWQVDEILRELDGPTVPVTVRRKGKDVTVTAPRSIQSKATVFFTRDGTRKLDASNYRLTPDDEEEKNVVWTSLVDGTKATRKPDELIAARADEIVELLGMVPRLRVTGLVQGGAAEEAGLMPGDIIVEYGDTPTPTIKQLLEISQEVGEKAGEKGALITVERNGKRLEPIRIVPRVERRGAFVGVCRHVDLASTVVAGVRPGSPAEKAGIQPGYVIDKVNGRTVQSWLEVFDALAALQGQEVSLTYRRSARPDAEAHAATIDNARFDPDDYEFTMFPGPHVGLLEPLQQVFQTSDFGDAVAWGARETVGFMATTYASIRALSRGTVSGKDFIGPVGIGAIAVEAARRGLTHLVYMMAFMSAILAVMNFLPLPVLDGGHAVFLLIEKLRGKPVSIKVMNYMQFVGLAAIGLLLVVLTWQDLKRFVF
jgi:regulator of sigma E protease